MLTAAFYQWFKQVHPSCPHTAVYSGDTIKILHICSALDHQCDADLDFCTPDQVKPFTQPGWWLLQCWPKYTDLGGLHGSDMNLPVARADSRMLILCWHILHPIED